MKIQFLNGDFAGEIKDFQGPEISIGREDGNTIQLLTGGVSRYHAQICRQQDDSWVIRDLNSTNGVKFGGKNITGDMILVPGMELVIGEQRLVILETAPAGQVRFFSTASETDTAPLKVEAKTEETAKPPVLDISGEKLLADLKSAGNGLFNRGEKASGNAGKKTDEPPKRSKLLFNVVFYSALLICVVFILKMALGSGKGADGANSGTGISHFPLEQAVVYFERIAYDPESKTAFRFEMQIENGKMVCNLDDVAGRRHFTREIDLAKNYETELEVLLQKLKESGICTFKPKNIVTGNPERDQVHLVLFYDNQFCDYKCASSESGVEFDTCRNAISNFLSGFGLMTISKNREELEAEAKQHLRNAIDKRENYVSDLSLLREAAREFEAAISCYEQFSPPPPELKQARTGFEEVNNLRRLKLKECNDEFKRCHRTMDYAGMVRACQDIMKIAGEKSKTYRNAAEALRSVKRTMNSKKR